MRHAHAHTLVCPAYQKIQISTLRTGMSNLKDFAITLKVASWMHLPYGQRLSSWLSIKISYVYIFARTGTNYVCVIDLQIVSTGPTPEWDEAFAWAFDSPPKGQKLHISCKNKSKIGKVMPKHNYNALHRLAAQTY